MIYSEIHDEVVRIVWGDTPPPASISSVVLSVGTTAENIATTAFVYRIAGVPYEASAVAAGTAFSAANTINTGAAAGLYWGVWLLQINSSGTFSTKPGGGLADQVYTTEALAIAALPAVDSGNFAVGYVTVQSNSGVDWVAITDDLTSGSDCNESNFYSLAIGDYKGTNGRIARIRKNLQDMYDFWFMEFSTSISLVANEIEYLLPDDFKTENSVLVYDSASDTYRDIERLNVKEFDQYLQDAQVSNLQESIITVATELGVGSTAENIASTAFRYRINNGSYSQAAVAAGTAFSAADTINTGAVAGTFWGVWLVQINETNTITTKSPSSDQVYATEAAAIAALPSPDSGNVDMGYVTVNSNSGAAWTAITDDLTAGSDCVASNFYNTASEIEHTNEWPLYYYIAPYSTTYRKMFIFPVPSEAKSDCIFIKYSAYLDDLSNVGQTWDAYSDYFSIECPELLIWAAVRDIAQTQKDNDLYNVAMNNVMAQDRLLRRRDWNYKSANTSDIPYEDV
jgi:hypothetical protein